jgi:hypothetical protein
MTECFNQYAFLDLLGSKKKYLVIGLEASTTRIVARMVAYNLGIIAHIDGWDGHYHIEDDACLVAHRSLPHLDRSAFYQLDDILKFDYIIIVTRDWNCSLNSKMRTHQPNPDGAINEHKMGIARLKEIADHVFAYNLSQLRWFSYETAYLLQDSYIRLFLRSIGVVEPKLVEILEINAKYFIR